MVRTFDVERGEFEVGEWRVRGERRGLTWSPDGERLALHMDCLEILSRDASGYPVLYSVPPLDADPRPFSGHGYACAFHPNQPLVACFAGECHAALWHLEERRYVGPAFGVYSTGRDVLAFDDEGKTLAVGNRIGVRTFDVETGVPVAPPSRNDGYEDEWREKYANAPTALSPNGAYYAEVGIEDTLRVYDARTCRALLPPIQHGSQVVAVGLGPQGLVATAGRNGRASVWRLGSEAPAEPMRLQGLSIRLLPDQRHAIVNELRTEVVLLDRQGEVRSFVLAGSASSYVEFDAEGRRALLGVELEGGRCTVALDLEEGEVVGGPFVIGEAWTVPFPEGGAFDGDTITVEDFCCTATFDLVSARCVSLGHPRRSYFWEEFEEPIDPQPWSGQTHQAVGDGWGLRSEDGRGVEAVDLETGEVLYELGRRGDVELLEALPGGRRILAAFEHDAHHLVDLESVPRHGETRSVRIPRDSVLIFDDPSLDLEELHERLDPALLVAPPRGFDTDAESWLEGESKYLFRYRLGGYPREFLGARRLVWSAYDLIGGWGAHRADGTWIASAREVEGGIDVRVIDFFDRGDTLAEGDPQALLADWKRRLGR